jgi:NADH-quinone oxidoreductase subunit M
MIGMLYRRSGSVRIADLGGIASQAPRFAFLFALFALAIAGIPGTGGFVGELLIIFGAFEHGLTTGFATALTMLAAILYVFWMLQRVLFGTPAHPEGSFRDLSALELALLLPLAFLLILTGVAPSLFTPLFEPQLQQMLAHLAATLSGGVQ